MFTFDLNLNVSRVFFLFFLSVCVRVTHPYIVSIYFPFEILLVIGQVITRLQI